MTTRLNLLVKLLRLQTTLLPEMKFELSFALSATTMKLCTFPVPLQTTLLTAVVPVLPAISIPMLLKYSLTLLVSGKRWWSLLGPGLFLWNP